VSIVLCFVFFERFLRLATIRAAGHRTCWMEYVGHDLY
jgi:hypothetical protein